MIVVGADAAGMSAAAQARRRRDKNDLEILAFEKSAWISYSACGEPYFVAGEVEFDDLLTRTPERFAQDDIDVRIHHEVVAIDTAAGTVTVRGPDGAEADHGYDVLMYATGTEPIVPRWDGIDLGGIHALHTLDDATTIESLVTEGTEPIVIVGAGYIGLEVAEALRVRGVTPTIVTLGPGVLERTLDPDIGTMVADRVRSMGIPVHEAAVSGFTGAGGQVTAVHTADGSEFPASLVVLGLGTRPRTALAEAASIPRGATGAVAVDDRQRTRVAGVWAAGDCAEATHRITGEQVNFHLATIANKQGRVAGMNIGGDDFTFPGVLGTAITKVCELELARTGLTEAEAAAAGIDAVAALTRSTTLSGYMPGSTDMHIKVVAGRGSGRLLGAQICGGPTAAKRIDVFAAALWSGMSLEELEFADLSYAPPFSSTWEPVQIAARNARRAARI